MTLSLEVRNAIEALYAVFAVYRLDAPIEACSHCHDRSELRTIEQTPLRQLDVNDLDHYVSCAMTTIGDVDDFRYFLPRLLEHLPEGKFQSDVPLVLGKLRYGDWCKWPRDEQASIRNYLRSVWCFVLAQPVNPSQYSPSRADEWLCAIANAESEIAPYLRAWLETEDPVSDANLFQLVDWNASDLLNGSVPPGYWDGAHAQWVQLVTWLTSAPLQKRLVRATQNLDEIDLAVKAEEIALLLSKVPVPIPRIGGPSAVLNL